MIGAEGGCDAGMLLGGEAGVWFFGWSAAPGALIGGFVGGIVGSIWGSNRGDDVYKDATQ